LFWYAFGFASRDSVFEEGSSPKIDSNNLFNEIKINLHSLENSSLASYIVLGNTTIINIVESISRFLPKMAICIKAGFKGNWNRRLVFTSFSYLVPLLLGTSWRHHFCILLSFYHLNSFGDSFTLCSVKCHTYVSLALRSHSKLVIWDKSKIQGVLIRGLVSSNFIVKCFCPSWKSSEAYPLFLHKLYTFFEF
jgi:hypothetical protein